MAALDLNDLKVIIKSIVISNPKPISVRDLQRDFKTNEGVEIPFHRMGFRNIWDFLGSLSDIVEILPDQTLRAVRTSETKHLQDLIEKQRGPKKRNASRRSGSRFRPSSYEKSPVSSYSHYQYSQQRAQYPRNQAGAWSTNGNTAQGSNSPQYQADFPVRRNSNYNQYSFGDSSEYSDDSFELVPAIDKTIAENQPERSNGIDHESHPERSSGNNHGNRTEPAVTNGYGNQSERSSGNNHGNQTERAVTNGYGNQPERSSGNNHGNQTERAVTNGYGNQPERSNGNNSRTGINGDSVHSSNWEAAPDTVFVLERNDVGAAIPIELKTRLKGILSEQPSGILCSRLPELYKEKFRQYLDSRDFGFSSMIELVDSISGVVKFEEKKSRDWIIFGHAEASPTWFTEKQEKVCERISNVTERLESSVNIEEFDELYEKAYGVSLSQEVAGFGTINSVLASMDRSVMRFDVINGLRVIVPGKCNSTSAESDCVPIGEVRRYPEGVLLPGEKVPRLERLLDAIVPVMEVKLVEIYSPQNFYVIPCATLESHNALMEKLQSFYAERDDLALTKYPVKHGLYCVAPYMDKWHRAVIISIVSPVLVRVFLIDFGTQLPIPKAKLRFLHTQFSVDPKQAVKAKLHNVAPPNNAERFSKEANVMFFELTADKILKAYLKGISFTKEQTVSLRLVDANQDKEVLIDEKLVQAGLAEFCQSNNQIKQDDVTGCPPRDEDNEKTVVAIKPHHEEEKPSTEITSPNGAFLRKLLSLQRSRT